MTEAPKQRLESLDAFRGLTIAGMILVNNQGDWGHVYPALGHADWHGWTPTDLIFPFFLFIVGVSMSFSFSRRVERGASTKGMYAHVVRRGLLLVLIGLLLHNFPRYLPLGDLRLPGVLQRIGVVYIVASRIVLTTRLRGQVIWAAAILLLYWGLETLVPVPGGLVKGGDLSACFDRTVLGESHLVWSSKYGRWDPEGLLSTLPAVATTLFGVMAGHWIRSDRDGYRKVSGLFFFGCVGVLVGLLWDMAFPINKKIWTSSYVVFSAGMGLLVLAYCYWLIDLHGWRKWSRPFVIYGVNPLTAFVGASLMARITVFLIRWTPEGGKATSLKTEVYNGLYRGLTGSPHFNSALFGLTYVLIWLGLMWILYRKKIIIKL